MKVFEDCEGYSGIVRLILETLVEVLGFPCHMYNIGNFSDSP